MSAAALNTSRRGNGRAPVLLLHGFLGSGRNLASLAQVLSEHDPSRCFILADMPGHGSSPALPEAPSFIALAEPVAALTAALAAEFSAPCDVIGHSMGGRVGLWTLAHSAGSVGRVMMLDVAPGPIGDRNADLERVVLSMLAAPETTATRGEMKDALLGSGLRPALADWLIMNLHTVARSDAGETLGWRFDRQKLYALGLATRGDDLWPEAERAAHRLACIYGGRSPFVTAVDVARLEALGAHCQRLDDAGHFVHVDAFKELTLLLSAWLAEAR